MKHQLTATHPALGTVVIVLDAKDRKHSFDQFKSLVFNHLQWRVTENVELNSEKNGGCVTKKEVEI
jgi:hypothetical protein